MASPRVPRSSLSDLRAAPAGERRRPPSRAALPLLLALLIAASGAALAGCGAPAPPAEREPGGGAQEDARGATPPVVPLPGAPALPAPAPADPAGQPPPPPELIEIEGPLLEADTWRRLGDGLLEKSIDFVPSLIKALIVLVAFYVFYRALIGVVGGVLRRTRADPGLLGITIRLLRYGLLGLAVIMALGQLGFNIASVLAGVGIVGLAIGLAAQETVANLIAGLTILWDRPFRIGDNVTIAGTFGKVRSIGLRTTRIETVERLDCILPNKEIVEQKIINHTMSPDYRLPVPIGIAYKEDTRKAREVLLAAVRGHELILDEPEPAVVVLGLGESSVDLELRVWLRDPYTEREALFDLVEIAKIALDEAGIEIPFPQRTLHFGSGTFPVRVEGDAGQQGRRAREGSRAERDIGGGAPLNRASAGRGSGTDPLERREKEER